MVKATEITSHSDARKYGPYIDEKDKPVYWVNWSKPTGPKNKKKRPHFKRFPNTQTYFGKIKSEQLQEAIEARSNESESELHKTARLELEKFIKKCIVNKEPINWGFKDERASSYSLTGDLLAEAVKVVTPYKFTTPFGLEYEYDIAILGPKLNKRHIVLAAIEIEYTHKFGLKKTMVSKCLGFPLIAIDITEYSIADINENWCHSIIKESKINSVDRLRRNFIYLHNFLYPLFLDLPEKYSRDSHHQFIIFSDDKSLKRLGSLVSKYGTLMGLKENQDFLIQQANLNPNVQSSINMFQNEGSIAGEDWNKVNPSRYLRLQVKKPFGKAGVLYLFHFVLGRLLNSYFNCLVGYKYERGLGNHNIESNVWTNYNETEKIVPKSLSEPTKTIIDYLINKGVSLDSFKNN